MFVSARMKVKHANLLSRQIDDFHFNFILRNQESYGIEYWTWNNKIIIVRLNNFGDTSSRSAAAATHYKWYNYRLLGGRGNKRKKTNKKNPQSKNVGILCATVCCFYAVCACNKVLSEKRRGKWGGGRGDDLLSKKPNNTTHVYERKQQQQ